VTQREVMTSGPSSQDSDSPVPRLLFSHPIGLYVLFLTEMWERFSFYGLRSLLVFYLIRRFGLSDQSAFAIYGNYSALVYIFPLVGGILADR
jgi:POT family proton-dependent oligopeptide transporter